MESFDVTNGDQEEQTVDIAAHSKPLLHKTGNHMHLTKQREPRVTSISSGG